MLSQLQDLPAFLFPLLSACRFLPPGSLGQLRRVMRTRNPAICPKLSFWLHLSQAAGLLDAQPVLRPTLLVAEWLGQPLDQQWHSILDAWCEMVSDRFGRGRRRRLLFLLAGQPAVVGFSQAQKRELGSLQNLGIWNGQSLTLLGEQALHNCLNNAGPAPQAWALQDGYLETPLPTDWKLLWDLEQFLTPAAPGQYHLNPKTLRQAAQRGSAEQLLVILENGTGQAVPAELVAKINSQPTVRLLDGMILEFSDAEELKRLRGATSAWRSRLNHLLSAAYFYRTGQGPSNSSQFRQEGNHCQRRSPPCAG